MSRNSSGTYSLPSGNPVVSGTTISSTWANTTLADIATEVTNSLDRSGRGAMLAPIQLPNGTSVAPAVTFSAEPASGIYRAGANDIRMQVNGAELQQWTASGSVITQPTTLSSTLAVTGLGSYSAGILVNGNASSQSGHAVVGNGSGPIGIGVWGTGSGTSPGVRATGSGSGFGLEVATGNAIFTGGNPASSTGFANTLTPKNICKAWAVIQTNGLGGISIVEGFNISSAAINGPAKAIDINFSTAMANTLYLAISQSENAIGSSAIMSASQIRVSTYGIGTGSLLDPATNTLTINFVVFGAQ